MTDSVSSSAGTADGMDIITLQDARARALNRRKHRRTGQRPEETRPMTQPYRDGRTNAVVPLVPRAAAARTAERHQAFVRAAYRTHGDCLLKYAKSFTAGDEQRAEDLLQEAMIRAWRFAEKLGSTPEMVRPWLFKVIRRLAIDSYRARLARPTEFDDSALERFTIPDSVDSTITAHLLSRAMGDLSVRHREVLVHRYYLDRSIEETAALLNIAEGTVKSRSSHALRLLRQALITHGAAPAGEAA